METRRARFSNLSRTASWHSSDKLSEMNSRIHVKATFEPRRTIEPIYTGGSVALDRGGRVLVTCLGEEAVLTELNTGRHLARIEGVCSFFSV